MLASASGGLLLPAPQSLPGRVTATGGFSSLHSVVHGRNDGALRALRTLPMCNGGGRWLLVDGRPSTAVGWGPKTIWRWRGGPLSPELALQPCSLGPYRLTRVVQRHEDRAYSSFLNQSWNRGTRDAGRGKEEQTMGIVRPPPIIARGHLRSTCVTFLTSFVASWPRLGSTPTQTTSTSPYNPANPALHLPIRLYNRTITLKWFQPRVL